LLETKKLPLLEAVLLVWPQLHFWLDSVIKMLIFLKKKLFWVD